MICPKCGAGCHYAPYHHEYACSRCNWMPSQEEIKFIGFDLEYVYHDELSDFDYSKLVKAFLSKEKEIEYRLFKGYYEYNWKKENPMDKADAYRTYMEYIDRLLMEADLSEWESNFTQSIKDQLEKRGSLTERQITVLQKIYAEKIR